jgi:hypothetical protein
MAETTLRLLGVHGVGHHPVGGSWEREWQDATAAGLGLTNTDLRASTSFVYYDDLFERIDLDFWDVARALAKLVQSAVTAPARGVASVRESLRWTAGMVVAWVEDEKFRKETRERLAEAIRTVKPDAVLGHSLGSLVCYDTFTHADTRDLVQGSVLVTLGSQIANPFVSGQFLAGRIQVPAACPHWYHLWNREDDVFTAPIRLSDERFTQVDTFFDIPGPADHAAPEYLKHRSAASGMWWRLAEPRVSRGLARAVAKKPSARTEARLSTPRHRALLIGINDYPDPKDRLEGCVNDAFLVSSVLQEMGIEAEDIRMVLDSRATARGIRERISWLLDDIQPDDRRILYYSGHGAQIPAYGVGGRTESTKECLVPYDFDWSDETAITDDWFHEVYAQLPYRSQFMAIFDCCHSGGMTRAGVPRARGIDPPDDVRHRALRWNRELDMWMDRDLAPSNRAFLEKKSPLREKPRMTDRLGFGMSLRELDKPSFTAVSRRLGHKGPYMPVLVYACKENELAYEYMHGAVSHGAFTFSLAKTLRREVRERRARPTYHDLVRMVRRDLRVLGYDQVPSLAGPREKLALAVPFPSAAARAKRRK